MTSTSAPRTPPQVMDWLQAGIPLSLLVDLFVADRLDSAEVMRREVAPWGSWGHQGWPHPAA